MSTIHLAAVELSKRAVALRAVKALLNRVGKYEGPDAADDAWRDATRACRDVLNGGRPVGLVQADAQDIEDAVRVFLEVDNGQNSARLIVDANTEYERFVPPMEPAEPETVTEAIRQMPKMKLVPPPGADAPVDLSRDSIEKKFISPTPADFDPSYQAARTAMVLMAAMDGKAASAWYYAKALGCSTEDVDLWVEVGNLIAETFGFEKQLPEDA